MSQPIELVLRDSNQRITAWITGYSDQDIEQLLKEHPSWYRSYYDPVYFP